VLEGGAVTRRAVEGSPQTYARVGGTLYLFIIVAALFGELFVRGRLIVRSDAAATASNILGSETLFRVGLAGEMLTCLCDVALAMILYVLLKPVSRNVALLAAFHRVTFVAVYATSKLFLVAAVVVLGGADYLKAFDPTQLQALAYLSLRLHGQGYGLSLIFFGVHCVLLGYLIYLSGYLPRIIGVLLVIGGLGYLVNSFAEILAPPVAASLFPWIMLPAAAAESGLALWLVVKGVDGPKWDEKSAGQRNGT
jgi:Domain of unknown function (DUF4386)